MLNLILRQKVRKSARLVTSENLWECYNTVTWHEESTSFEISLLTSLALLGTLCDEMKFTILLIIEFVHASVSIWGSSNDIQYHYQWLLAIIGNYKQKQRPDIVHEYQRGNKIKGYNKFFNWTKPAFLIRYGIYPREPFTGCLTCDLDLQSEPNLVFLLEKSVSLKYKQTWNRLLGYILYLIRKASVVHLFNMSCRLLWGSVITA